MQQAALRLVEAEGHMQPGEPGGMAAPRPSQLRSPRAVLIGADLLALTAVWAVMALLTSRVPLLDEGLGRRWLAVAGVAVIGSIVTFRAQGMYRTRVCSLKSVESWCVVRATISVVVLMLATIALVEHQTHPKGLLVAAGLQIVLVIAGRSAYRSWLSAHRSNGRYARPVILVGGNDEAAALYGLIAGHPEVGLQVCGYIAPTASVSVPGFVPWLGTVATAAEAALAAGAEGAVVAASAHTPDDLNALVRRLMEAGLHVQMSSGLQGIAAQRLRAQSLAREPIFYIEPSGLPARKLALKRALDIAVASIVTVLTAPVLLLAALAVKLEDRGPVLFRQERVGRNGVPFVMLKLRSMVPDAEARQALIGNLNERSGPLFKASDDPRVTRVGRILRATSIDELPQLFNVLRGSMSLVGPRPALASEVEHFDEALQARTRVMPGVTGLWQIEARDNASFADYRRLDLFYLENWSVGFDLVIMLSTVLEVPKRALRSRTRSRRRAVAIATTSLP